jgi:hypothetical protein
LDPSDPKGDAVAQQLTKIREYADKAYHEDAPAIISLPAVSVLTALPFDKMQERMGREAAETLNSMVRAQPGIFAKHPRLAMVLMTLRKSGIPELEALAKQYAADWGAWTGINLPVLIERQLLPEGTGRGRAAS